jgi:hypothetical protein
MNKVPSLGRNKWFVIFASPVMIWKDPARLKIQEIKVSFK